MTTLTKTVNLSGNPDTEDRRWMMYIINVANEAITVENNRRTQLNNASPPPNPLWQMLPLFPFATAPERKTSAETILSTRIAEVIGKYINQANEKADKEANLDAAFRDFKIQYAEANDQKQAAAIAAGLAALQ